MRKSRILIWTMATYYITNQLKSHLMNNDWRIPKKIKYDGSKLFNIICEWKIFVFSGSLNNWQISWTICWLNHHIYNVRQLFSILTSWFFILEEGLTSLCSITYPYTANEPHHFSQLEGSIESQCKWHELGLDSIKNYKCKCFVY